MFPVFLLSPLLLALAVSTNTIVVERSTVTLPLSRRLNVTNIHNLVRRDQKRAKALQAKGAAQTSTDLTSRVVINEQVENQAVGYIASVGVGFPPITCEYSFSCVIHLSPDSNLDLEQTPCSLTLEGIFVSVFD